MAQYEKKCKLIKREVTMTTLIDILLNNYQHIV